jgi:hypothetical protein
MMCSLSRFLSRYSLPPSVSRSSIVNGIVRVDTEYLYTRERESFIRISQRATTLSTLESSRGSVKVSCQKYLGNFHSGGITRPWLRIVRFPLISRIGTSYRYRSIFAIFPRRARARTIRIKNGISGTSYTSGARMDAPVRETERERERERERESVVFARSRRQRDAIFNHERAC